MKIFHQHNKTSSLQCTIYIYLTKEPSLPLYDTQPLYKVTKNWTIINNSINRTPKNAHR